MFEHVFTLKEILIVLGTPVLFLALHYLGEWLIKWEMRGRK